MLKVRKAVCKTINDNYEKIGTAESNIQQKRFGPLFFESCKEKILEITKEKKTLQYWIKLQVYTYLTGLHIFNINWRTERVQRQQ